MITVKVPLQRTNFQVLNLGTISYNYPTSLSSTQVDEILVSNATSKDQNQIAFIKRYNTWVLYTLINNDIPQHKYNILYIYYDNVNKIAYTASDVLHIIPQG